MTLSAAETALLLDLKARGATNIELAMACWLIPSIELERVLRVMQQQLLNVNTAQGFALDQIGALVGRRRQGVDDDEVYRRYVRSQLSANRSDGSIVDILQVTSLVVYDDDATYVVQNLGAAGYVLRIEGVALPTTAEDPLVTQVLKATAAGVRALIGYSLDPPSEVLRWGTAGRTWGTSKWSHITDRRG